MKYRRHKKDNYTCIDNHVFRDDSLSMKAKGLLAQIYSLPDDWEYSVKGLTLLFSDGKDAVNNALQELIDHGYIIRSQRINKLGKFDGYEYDIYETPQIQNADNPITDNPITDNPITDNLPQLNTNILNTKESNTNILKKESKKKESGYDAIMDSVSFIKDDPELRESIVSFIKMRKMIKKPLTDDALKLNINKAYKLAKGDPVIMKAIFEQSVMNSWQGVFELKEETNQKKPAVPSKQPAAVNPFTELRRQLGYDTGANTSVIGEAVGQLPKLQG